MKSTEIKELTDKEIKEKLVAEKEALVRMKLNHTISPIEQPHKISESRKNIAQLKTELRQRVLNK
jgi:large subunit ribosomal protein L29